MSLHHFSHQGINGAWHAVYRMAGCDSLASIGQSDSKLGADLIAKTANAAQEKNSTCFVEPSERRLIAGFYTDKDAS